MGVIPEGEGVAGVSLGVNDGSTGLGVSDGATTEPDSGGRIPEGDGVGNTPVTSEMKLDSKSVAEGRTTGPVGVGVGISERMLEMMIGTSEAGISGTIEDRMPETSETNEET